MKKYCYCYTDSKTPTMEGVLKYFGRKVKEPRTYNKELRNYVHIYMLEGEEYKLLETKCIPYFMASLRDEETRNAEKESLARFLFG